MLTFQLNVSSSFIFIKTAVGYLDIWIVYSKACLGRSQYTEYLTDTEVSYKENGVSYLFEKPSFDPTADPVGRCQKPKFCI